MPVGVLAAALTVSVTLAGLPEVGIAGFGAKLQVAPVGSPLEQLSVTDCANDPNAVTWNWAVFDDPSCTVTAPGAVRPKSTTCRVTGVSWVTVLASEPTVWMLKL